MGCHLSADAVGSFQDAACESMLVCKLQAPGSVGQMGCPYKPDAARGLKDIACASISVCKGQTYARVWQ